MLEYAYNHVFIYLPYWQNAKPVYCLYDGVTTRLQNNSQLCLHGPVRLAKIQQAKRGAWLRSSPRTQDHVGLVFPTLVSVLISLRISQLQDDNHDNNLKQSNPYTCTFVV